MTNTHRLQIRASTLRGELEKLAELDDPTPDQLTAMEDKGKELDSVEIQYRASLRAEPETAVVQTGDAAPEVRERLELRSEAKLTNYLRSYMQGNLPTGAEAELMAAAGVSEGIPVELYDVAPPLELRADSVTDSPSTVGVNLQPIFPLIYARSVLPRCGVSMPTVPSGSYATATVTSGLSAAAKAKGAKQDSSAATITSQSTVAHRVTARLSIAIEDIVSVGAANFESRLRSQLMLAMSAKLDELGLNGDNTDPNPHGLLPQLDDPDDPTTAIDFDGFVKLASDGIDGGPWAEDLTAVRLLLNADAMKLAERTFQSASAYKGETSSAAYLRQHSGGLMSSSRMPATATNIAQALRIRMGTMGLDGVNAGELAICPSYASIGIDDIYSDSGSGLRHFTLHTLIGDILIVQRTAFERVDIKIA